MRNSAYPEENAGWVQTLASRRSQSAGCNYEDPSRERTYVIIQPEQSTIDRSATFKYNPHTRPGELVQVTGFTDKEELIEYAMAWMDANPAVNNTMKNETGGLMSFTQQDEDTGDKTEDEGADESHSEDTTTPLIQDNPTAILSSYNLRGEYVGESPGEKGITHPAEFPPEEEWPDRWVDKTAEFERFVEGMDDCRRTRKRIECPCGLTKEVTGTCISIVCHSCGRSIIDKDPAESPGETDGKNSKQSHDTGELTSETTQKSEASGGGSSSEDEGDASGLKAFVQKNS